MPVARIAGVGHQHLVSRVDERAARERERGGGAGGDDDAFGVDVDSESVTVVARDRAAMGWASVR